ncbi:hypothetical protein P5P86_00145 [Nocardioides sp. BP30]|uniref:hypothetical protein n=1 Tax=Nocardioides sp. BP30 TaxID=3036374 RepID=UPI002469BC7D|nr:hypothetical protein [Nocardioides sp. BP30]WGL52258.1 hypothetical protein P5P86_00145 [Nocardioides sp. BP30]
MAERHDRDTAARIGPWIVLVASLLCFGVLGVLPVWQYAANHRPGVPVEQARVTRCASVQRSGIVCAHTADGRPIAVVWEGHVTRPRSGSTLQVFEKGGRWHARNERAFPFWAPVFLLLGGLGTLACLLTLGRRLRHAVDRWGRSVRS